jgi:hypothetical protein
MRLNYLVPNNSRLNESVHEAVADILPFEISFGGIARYEPHLKDRLIGKGKFVDLFESTVSVRQPEGLDVIVSHESGNYKDPSKNHIPIFVGGPTQDGDHNYGGDYLPDKEKPVIVVGIPNDSENEYSAKILAHEVVHAYLMSIGDNDYASHHCSNSVGDKQCLMSPPESYGYLSSVDLERVAKEFCEPCGQKIK